MGIDRVVEVTLPVAADLSLASLDAAIEIVSPEMRPVLLVGDPLREVAELLRTERDLTVRVVEVTSVHWWALESGEVRCVVDP